MLVKIKMICNEYFFSQLEQIKKTSVDYSLVQAEKHELKFHVFTNTLLDGAEVTEQDVNKINLKTNIPTKIFIHGWNSHIKTNWYDAFRDAYFKKGEHNVIYVDWFIPGSRDYSVSAANVKPVGHFIAEFLNATKIDVKNIHLIGKSLGGHVAAWAGKRTEDLTGKKLGRITALDPAAPKFEHPNVTEADRLSKNDADFVDVVHTDIEYYGYEKPLGTVDFYPNGGGTQPGCKTDDAGRKQSLQELR